MLKKIIITFITLCILTLVTIFLIIPAFKNNKEQESKVKCTELTGGSFNLNFVTNTSQELQTISVCIACSPSSYEKLPILSDEGKTFEGWFYDEKLTQKINSETTLGIMPIKKYDSNGCHAGYSDVTIYAKWK